MQWRSAAGLTLCRILCCHGLNCLLCHLDHPPPRLSHSSVNVVSLPMRGIQKKSMPIAYQPTTHVEQAHARTTLKYAMNARHQTPRNALNRSSPGSQQTTVHHPLSSSDHPHYPSASAHPMFYEWLPFAYPSDTAVRSRHQTALLHCSHCLH
jgi:hypothetical protein